MPHYIGIDPGASGALVALGADGTVLSAAKMPETERDVADWLREWGLGAAHAVIEHVHAMPKQGVSSSFKFGRCYGMLLMGLTCAGVPFTAVRSYVWQRQMQCLTKGDKNVSKRRAQQLFPDFRVTHATADALLIAEYCRSVLGAQPAAQHVVEATQGEIPW